MDELLEMREISKIYGNGVYANRQVNFSVREGEIHALVGENGAGKSTLMKVLFGLERPDLGEIVLKGEAQSFQSPHDAMACGIGMVHQHFMLVDAFSVTENVTMGHEPLKKGLIDSKRSREMVSMLAERFNLKIDPDALVRDLPVGAKQKVEILKALFRGAKILILDEPTAVLTPQETADLFAQLVSLKEQGFTVIFITHKLKEVKEISDRVSVMRDGKMIATVNTCDVTEADISALMMGSGYSSEFRESRPAPGEVALAVDSLCFVDAEKRTVVDRVSFTVRRGEILGIAGVGGNGQTELIGTISGRYRAASGRITLFGQDITRAPVRKLRETGMAYIPSDRMSFGVTAKMSVEENLITTKLNDKKLINNAGFMSRKRIRKLSASLVQAYAIKCKSPETAVEMLSGGNIQKVVVAREFTQENAGLIIAEHPTRGVDIGAAKLIHERLIALRDAGYAVLLVSADLEELYKLSGSFLVMYNGKFSAYFQDPSAISEQELGNYMLGVRSQEAGEVGRAYYAQ